MTGDEAVIDAFVRDTLASKKYRGLCPATARDAIESTLPRYRRTADAIKAARARLHQAHAAYLGATPLDWDLRALREARETGGAALRTLCLQWMAGHASTRERQPIIEGFHRAIFDITGIPRRVLDPASGVHPLCIPWMDLPPGAEYHAYEIEQRMADALDLLFEGLGVAGRCHWQDVVVDPPAESGDLAFLMKLIPCLEQRERGAALRLMDRLDVDWIVATFPVRSLSGRSKHMPGHYRALFGGMCAERGWEPIEVRCDAELVFVVRKR